ncbi:secondary thiamine-phosphate synthase enzyme YjbQ [Yunchengibacter salinarum]|uniref:secondary thiamine-phosphate synthase enzyme YjbQ n=1 Tax=Yunchengibacter salinarum TaxID=3133399 RepID=UPI0035B6330F
MTPITHQSQYCLTIETPGRTTGPGMVDITGHVVRQVTESGIRTGIAHLFIGHTSASLTIQENADPDVQADLADSLARLAPEDGNYRHTAEGPDDMPAHIKAALTDVSLSIPVTDGRLGLGTWQGIYVLEHRARPHRRHITLHLTGAP